MRPPESSLKNGGIVDVKFCSTDQLNHDEFHWIIFCTFQKVELVQKKKGPHFYF